MSKRISDQLPDCQSFLVVISTAKGFHLADCRSRKIPSVGNSAAAECSYTENEVLEVKPHILKTQLQQRKLAVSPPLQDGIVKTGPVPVSLSNCRAEEFC